MPESIVGGHIGNGIFKFKIKCSKCNIHGHLGNVALQRNHIQYVMYWCQYRKVMTFKLACGHFMIDMQYLMKNIATII